MMKSADTNSNLKRNQNITDYVFLLIICSIHVALLYLICSYTRRPETYGDELIYIERARSIVSGTGFEIHAAPFNFSNVLYSFALAPAFFISDTLVRIKVIVLINSILVTSALVPIFLLCKELKVNRKNTWLVVLIMCFWPDMAIVATFMSENLFFPLSILAAYLCIKSFNGNNGLTIAFAGIVSYFAYFCKEVGLCIALTYVATEVLFSIFCPIEGKKGFVGRLRHIGFKRILIFIMSFAVCYAAVKMFILRGVSSAYAGVSSSALGQLADSNARHYLYYCVLYFLASCLIAFFIIPVLAPLVKLGKMSFLQRKAYLFEIILLLGTILVITMTISVREDMGNPIPSMHLRYLFPIIGIVLPVFFASIQYGNEIDKKIYWLLLPACWGIMWIFKGVKIGCSTAANSLMWARKVMNDIGREEPALLSFKPSVLKWLFAVSAVILLCALLNKFIKKGLIIVLFEIIAIIVCLKNFRLSYDFIRQTYEADDKAVHEMDLINDYFIDNDLTYTNVLFVGAGPFSIDSKIYDFYFDAAGDEMEITYDVLMNYANSETYTDNVSDMVLNESIWGIGYMPERIDYFIVGDGFDGLENVFAGIEIDENLSGEKFLVYKNINPKTLELAK